MEMDQKRIIFDLIFIFTKIQLHLLTDLIVQVNIQFAYDKHEKNLFENVK